MFTDAHRGRRISCFMYSYALTLTSLFMFCCTVSCFICRNLTLPSFKRGVFVRIFWSNPTAETVTLNAYIFLEGTGGRGGGGKKSVLRYVRTK